MQRLIQDTIRKALADELLFGRLTGRRAADRRHDEDAQADTNGIVLDIQPFRKRAQTRQDGSRRNAGLKQSGGVPPAKKQDCWRKQESCFFAA